MFSVTLVLVFYSFTTNFTPFRYHFIKNWKVRNLTYCNLSHLALMLISLRKNGLT